MLRAAVLILVALGTLVFTVRHEAFMRRVFLLRVPLFTFAACILFPLVGLTLGQPTIEGVFAQESSLQIGAIVFAGACCLFAARRALRLGIRAGRQRYPRSFPSETPEALGGQRERWRARFRRRQERLASAWAPLDVWDHLWTTLCTLPLILATVKLSVEHRTTPGTSTVTAGSGVLWCLVALAAAIGTFAALDRLYRWVQKRDATALVRFLEARPPSIREGYVVGGRLLPGHLYAMTGLVLLAIAFRLASMFLDPAGLGAKVPALCYLFLLGVFLLYFLSGAAFFFDRFRVPVLVVVLVSSVIAYAVWNVDHYFEVLPFEGNEPSRLVAADDAVRARIDRANASSADKGAPLRDKLVVICAAGGGIRAAGWTAHALSELHAESDGAFTRRVGCVSGVSGGSVGLTYFFEGVRRWGPELGDAEHEAIWNATTRTSLNAALWGWVIKDVPRAVPFLVPEPKDRGWALEQNWMSALPSQAGEELAQRGFRARLLDWSVSSSEGHLPAAFFNATGLRTGRRYVFSNASMDTEAVDVTALYGGDTTLVTAARMSATFPFVTPMARPGRLDPSSDELVAWSHDGEDFEHLADGGYYDNLGVVTALEWLADVGPTLTERGVREVALINIIPFPRTPDAKERGEEEPSLLGRLIPESTASSLLASFLGPAVLIQQVRTSTQVERGAFEQELRQRSQEGPRLTSFVLRPLPDSSVGPLTWHLTDRQKLAIRKDWERMKTADPEHGGGYRALVDWLRSGD